MTQNLILKIILLATISGCAKLSYRPKLFIKNKKEAQAYQLLAEKMSTEDVKNIKVLVNKFPKGITFSKNKKKIKVRNKKIRYLGKVYAEFNPPSIFEFYEYPEDQSWRNTYCHFQQVMGYMTLGLWLLSPTYYPCYVHDTSNSREAVAERRERMINTMKKMTKAMGGHILVVDKIGKLKPKKGKQINSIAAHGYAFEYIPR